LLSRRPEVSGWGKLDAARLRELVGAWADEHYVLCVFHHAAGELHWVLHGTYAGHGAASKVAAVHDRGVQLMLAAVVEGGAAAGVELGGVLECGNDALDDVEAGVAAGEHIAAEGDGALEVGLDCCEVSVGRAGPGAGAAMHGDGVVEARVFSSVSDINSRGSDRHQNKYVKQLMVEGYVHGSIVNQILRPHLAPGQ
jgi:hypothetical protein